MGEKELITVAVICLVIGIIIIYSVPAQSSSIKINNPLDMRVYFCPKDDCRSVFINTVKDASEVHCAFYDLDIQELIDALKEKQALLITDKSNKINNSVTNKGYQLMHNKFCILDDAEIITGSMNPTKNDASLNNNNLVVINSKELAKNYEEEFQEMYQGLFGGGSKTKYTKFMFTDSILENYFCPEDKCSEKVIKHLNNAKESVYFMAFSFTHYKIAQTLIQKNKEGVKVKGIIEKTQQVQDNQFNSLKSNNISVIYDNNPYKMHHKVFIIDNKTVILGSFNPTKAADTKNDENILIIQNEKIAKKFIQEFDSLL